VVSALARVEVAAALWRKHRDGELEPEDARALAGALAADFNGTESDGPRFASIAMTAALLEEAAELVAVHDLRASDAVQLASALAARAAEPRLTDFACFDERLRRAAAQRGLRLVPG
jgi:predicted nucleic acid-binding protein